MTIALIIISAWLLVSVPLGLLLGGALRVCEQGSVANLPRRLSQPMPVVERALEVAA